MPDNMPICLTVYVHKCDKRQGECTQSNQCQHADTDKEYSIVSASKINGECFTTIQTCEI